MGKEYKAILFDLGNTLIRFDHNIAVKKLQAVYSIDPKRTYDLFFDSEITHLFEKGLISTEDFYRKATALLGVEAPMSEFLPIWNEIFWEDDDSCALARRLKGKYKLVLLSNINEAHFDYIEKRFKIIEIFDELILSYRVGAMKPDRKIYDEAVRASGNDRQSLIYIDDREDLIKESTKMGIDSIRFENARQLESELVKVNILPC